MEKRVELITRRVKWICDACLQGEMEFIAEGIPSLSGRFKRYMHRCAHCQHTVALSRIYPRIEYEEVDRSFDTMDWEPKTERDPSKW